MQNPFTTTFSKKPEFTYIETSQIKEILENFSYPNPSESVYKITGVRGSGKTVLLARIEEELKSKENRYRGWLVLDLSPARDLLAQMQAQLIQAGFKTPAMKSRNITLSANILGSGGSIGYSSRKEDRTVDIGVEIESMLQQVQKQEKRILIGIDEISRTKQMIEFTSEFGRWLRAGYPVYLVCTGLYENMQEISNVKNLTFFRRATTIKTEPLSLIRMSQMYKKHLSVDSQMAHELARMTKGYAYAFQQLGVLVFKNKDAALSEILEDFKTELYACSYEKIWKELSENDRFLACQLIGKEEYKRSEVLERMGARSANYSVYRDRLIKRGILNSRQGYISLALPFFAEYIQEYCLENLK